TLFFNHLFFLSLHQLHLLCHQHHYLRHPLLHFLLLPQLLFLLIPLRVVRIVVRDFCSVFVLPAGPAFFCLVLVVLGYVSFLKWRGLRKKKGFGH
ncbi:hypothetical protein VIGAN_01219700, partial [Vigna angularis var. angularis]